jgi:choline dehydrogenase-like flavoprotein
MEVAKTFGLPIIEDANAPDTPTVCYCHLDAMLDDRGRRHSTNRAFVPTRIALERQQRLKICTRTFARRLEWGEDDEGNPIVSGVYFQSRDTANNRLQGKVCFARARKEVILCSGAFGSPQLLMLR